MNWWAWPGLETSLRMPRRAYVEQAWKAYCQTENACLSLKKAHFQPKKPIFSLKKSNLSLKSLIQAWKGPFFAWKSLFSAWKSLFSAWKIPFSIWKSLYASMNHLIITVKIQKTNNCLVFSFSASTSFFCLLQPYFRIFHTKFAIVASSGRKFSKKKRNIVLFHWCLNPLKTYMNKHNQQGVFDERNGLWKGQKLRGFRGKIEWILERKGLFLGNSKNSKHLKFKKKFFFSAFYLLSWNVQKKLNQFFFLVFSDFFWIFWKKMNYKKYLKNIFCDFFLQFSEFFVAFRKIFVKVFWNGMSPMFFKKKIF